MPEVRGVAVPVRAVSNARNDDPRLVDPIEPAGRLALVGDVPPPGAPPGTSGSLF